MAWADLSCFLPLLHEIFEQQQQHIPHLNAMGKVDGSDEMVYGSKVRVALGDELPLLVLDS